MGYFSRIEFDERVLCEHRGANIPCVVWRSRESQILHSKENGVVHIKKCRKNHP